MGYFLDKLAEEIVEMKIAADEVEAATAKPGWFKRTYSSVKDHIARHPKKYTAGAATLSTAGLAALIRYLEKNKKGPFA